MIGIDVETTALDPADGQLRLVQISDGAQTDVHDAFLDPTSEIRAAVEEYEELVAHNAVFEREWLRAALDLDRPDLHDTMIMSQVYYTGTRAALSGSFSHSLSAVVKRELKRELAKDEQTSDWCALALTREQIEYAAEDALVLVELSETLMRKIRRAKLEKVYELERRVSHAVAAMEGRGVAVHVDKLDELIEESTTRAEELKSELAERRDVGHQSRVLEAAARALPARRAQGLAEDTGGRAENGSGSDEAPARRGAERREVGRVEGDREDTLDVRQEHPRQAHAGGAGARAL
jgi:ribonuclease D